MHLDPEARARQNIDAQLTAAGWVVQHKRELNLYAGRGIALREFQFESGPGDYLLLVDRKAVGVIEAKKEGETLTHVEGQAARYGEGLHGVPAPINPLPFQYLSTGVETRFTNLLDPEPRSRELFTFHRPDQLADWLDAEPLWLPAGHRLQDQPASMRLRLQNLPELNAAGLWPAQERAVRRRSRRVRGAVQPRQSE